MTRCCAVAALSFSPVLVIIGSFVANGIFWLLFHIVPARRCYEFISHDDELPTAVCLILGQNYMLFATLIITIPLVMVSIPWWIYKWFTRDPKAPRSRRAWEPFLAGDMLFLLGVLVVIMIPSTPYQYGAFKFCKPDGVVTTWNIEPPDGVYGGKGHSDFYYFINVPKQLEFNLTQRFLKDICSAHGRTYGFTGPFGVSPKPVPTEEFKDRKFKQAYTDFSFSSPDGGNITDVARLCVTSQDDPFASPCDVIPCSSPAQTPYFFCSYLVTSVVFTAVAAMCLAAYAVFRCSRFHKSATPEGEVAK